MNVYPVGKEAENLYTGSGAGLGAISNGAVVDIVYFTDVFDDFFDFGDFSDKDELAIRIEQFISNDEVMGPIIARLSAKGEVVVGLFSCMELCEL